MALSGEEDDSFSPSSERLVDCYLCGKIEGTFSGLAKAAYFRDTDVCSARPEELVGAHGTPARVSTRDAGDGQQWYFFSPARFVGTSKRRSRTVDGTGEKESWHAEGRPKPIEFSTAGGYVTKLSYHVRIGPKIVDKPGWIMAEYTMKDTGAGDLVLCKIYKSPRGAGRSASSSSSCTSSSMSGCKRKAADDLEEATSSRRPRQTSQEEDDAMLFATDLEQGLMSVEDLEAASEIVEMQNVPQIHPEQQVDELQRTAMAEDDDGMTLLVPDGGNPEAYFMGLLFGNSKPQDIDELLFHDPFCSHSGGNLAVPCT